jgi:hypothetical protein
VLHWCVHLVLRPFTLACHDECCAWQAEETAAAAYNAIAPPLAQPRLMPAARSTPNLLAAAAAGAAGVAATVSQPAVSL